MKWLRTTKVVGGRSAQLGGSGLGLGTALLRNRGLERALAVVTVTALMMSLMIALAPPALAHHPILEVSAVCDAQGNKVVTWKVSNGNWEGRTMTVDLVQYTDGVSGWTNIVVGLALGPNGSASETVVYPLAETGTKTLTVRGDWSGGGSQNVSSSLSTDLKKLECDGSTTTTHGSTTTTKATTTTTEGSTTTTEGSTTTTDGSTTTTGGSTTTTDGSTTTTGGSTTTTDGSTTTTESTTTTTIVGVATTDPDDQVGGITVTTSPGGDGSVEGTLPFTGLDAGLLVGLGASALALGALLLFAMRREET